MPKKISRKNTDPSSATDGGINTPDIDPKTGKIQQVAIADADQAYGIAKAFFDGGKERDRKNGIITSKYNGDSPWVQTKLDNAGQGWRNNVCTGFLSSIVDRKQPEFVQAIEGVSALTNAQLDEKFQNADKKSAYFRQCLTELIRSWEGWRDFLHAASMENLLYGYACVAWTDKYNWRPELFTQGNFQVPDDVAQSSSRCQVLVLRKKYLINEAIKKIADTKSAHLAGWNIPNWVQAINNARPADKAGSIDKNRAREYADLARMGTLFESYRTGSKVIECYEVFGMEANGMITQYLVGAKDGKEYFHQRYRYNSMTDVCTFLSLQVGNQKLLGSKGLGRMLLNLSIAAERARNLALDCCTLSQNLIIRVAAKDYNKIKNLQMSVVSPFTIVAIDGEFIEMKIEFDQEMFAALDNKLVYLAETVAGAVLPGSMNPDSGTDEKTATQSALDAQREQNTKAGVMARWAYQVSNMVSCIQRKATDPGTTDLQAKAFQKKLKQYGFTADEILAIGREPAARSLQDLEVVRKAQIQAISMKYGATPFVNQSKLVEMDIESMSSPQIKNEIFLQPEQLEANEIEAVQKQILEDAAMLEGQSVPVSPRDNHPIHRATGKKDLLVLAEVIATAPDPAILKAIDLGFQHFQEHLQKELQVTGQATPEMKADAEWLKDAQAALKKAMQLAKQLMPPSEGEPNRLPIPKNTVTSVPPA